MADYDEARMYARRQAPGDIDRASSLLDSAGRQFTEIGMPGWILRTDELRGRIG